MWRSIFSISVLMIFYTEPFLKRYKGRCWSVTGLAVFVVMATLLVLPFLTALYTQGFWLKQSSFREQPTVTFQRQFLYTLEGYAATTQESTFLTWSSDPRYNKFVPSESLRMPTAKFAEVDQDHDGVNDYLQFTITVPMSALEVAQSVRLALFFQYHLKNVITLDMESMATINLQDVIPGSGVYVTGDLRFQQRGLLPAWQVRSLYNTPVINWTLAEQDPSQVTWRSIQESDANRADRTVFQMAGAPAWTSGRASDQPFVVEGKIWYVEEEIHYLPSIGELFKWAWIQYYSFYVLFAAVLIPFLGYLLKNQLVPSMYVAEDVQMSGGGGYQSVRGASAVTAASTFQKHYF